MPDIDAAKRSTLAENLVEKAASTSTKPVTSTETVTVCCKIPSGIRIAAHVWEDYEEPTPTGISRRAKRAVEIGSQVIGGPSRLNDADDLRRSANPSCRSDYHGSER